jgi:hypothetical protein
MEIRHKSMKKEDKASIQEEDSLGRLIPFPKKLPVSSSKIKILFHSVFHAENQTKSE